MSYADYQQILDARLREARRARSANRPTGVGYEVEQLIIRKWCEAGATGSVFVAYVDIVDELGCHRDAVKKAVRRMVASGRWTIITGAGPISTSFTPAGIDATEVSN